MIIQRLWRQRKVKEFISEFITPRSHGQVQGVWSNRETVGSKLDVTSITQEQTEELIRKYQEKKEVFMDNVVTSEERKEGRDTSPIRMAFEKELHSTEIVTESPTRLDLRGLELSEEIVPDQ